jgi:hypothetical protein
MAYSVKSKKSGSTYYLHLKELDRSGTTTRLYFFAKEVKPGAMDQLPAGYNVVENERTGLPFLKKKK